MIGAAATMPRYRATLKRSRKAPVGPRKTTLFRPARWISRLKGSDEQNQATMVQTVPAAMEMMSARRRASRSSITVILASGSLWTEGGSPRPLVNRAIAEPLALALCVGLGRFCRGLRGVRRNRRRRLLGHHLFRRRRALFLGRGGFHLVDDLVRLPPELANATPDRAPQLRQLAGTEDDQHDDQKNYQEAGMNPKRHMCLLYLQAIITTACRSSRVTCA